MTTWPEIVKVIQMQIGRVYFANEELTQKAGIIKVARYSFARPIPPKFEHKLRHHKTKFWKNCHHSCIR